MFVCCIPAGKPLFFLLTTLPGKLKTKTGSSAFDFYGNYWSFGCLMLSYAQKEVFYHVSIF